ncbi:MAG: CoB--CoM heterodisulfide reductase iron-sulfur subunit A family protein [Thermoplasmata archaeon]
MNGSALVIGGGIAGIQAALDLAEAGVKVHLVERSPSIGGRMAQLDKTFPTNDCSICILAPKMADCYGHPNINVLTCSELIELHGEAGNFTARIMKRARYVDEDRCTGCGECMDKCPTKVPNEFDYGMSVRKAIYIPFMQAVPRVALIDRDRCLMLTKGKCGLCQKTCKRGAVDYEMKDVILEVNIGAVVVAVGFDLWDPSVASEYGYGKYPNVFTSMEYERMLNASGPTGGQLRRRSDGERPKRVAFIQCVGSRNPSLGHPYCCAVCCMHSTKQAIISREHYDDIETTIFYKDIRTPGKGFNEYMERARSEYGVRYINSDATVEEKPENHNLYVLYDVAGKSAREEFDAVVLAVTLVPRKGVDSLARVLGISITEHGFFKSADRILRPSDSTREGIFLAGYCASPVDIPESVAQGSAAAARAMDVILSAAKRKGEAEVRA